MNQDQPTCHSASPEPSPSETFVAFTAGLWKQNPVFVMVLGMCPTLAITNSVRNAIAMGLATTFVMASANAFISMVRKLVPKQVRIATYISMIATSVTIVDYLVKAISIPVYKALGPFIPLIVSNCLTLERAESYAGKNPIGKSILDGLGMGLGFTFALTCLGTVREVLGAGTFLGFPLFGSNFEPWVLFLLPPGGFITLAMWLLTFTLWRERSDKRKRAREAALEKPVEIAS
ncbi:MAG: electron transport complex subunit E [Acidobacteriia bacterium]|nr:electron transport complex subunit E [Terriglobia bacterium]